MSHKATNWAIARRGLKPTAKIILWQLCDRHHKDHGCFPSQETLADDCEISRGTLNRYLDDLEARGLIRRIQRSDKKSRKQLSTMYLFAFDFDDPYGFDTDETSPEIGPSSAAKSEESSTNQGEKPCLKMRQGTVSQKRPKPCLKKRDSRVSKRDTNPVREPLKNQRACGGEGKISEIAAFWAQKVIDGGHIPESVLTEAIKIEIRGSGWLTQEQLLASGIAVRKRAG
ncbi:helix-turn-helix domain-containing protein [Sulfitobacter pacificus]|nr:helix-turn-helix domain-containing protein [Sulfitobacter pacificus]